MYERIPDLDRLEIRKNYAKQIQYSLGDSSLWSVSASRFIPALILGQENYFKKGGNIGITGIYVLGISEGLEKSGFRGIRVFFRRGTKSANFCDLLVNKMGYKENSVDVDPLSIFEKSIDKSEVLVKELKELEELVRQQI